MVQEKDDYWLKMDLKDLESAGAFIDSEIWDKFILKKKDQITIKPNDYTRK